MDEVKLSAKWKEFQSDKREKVVGTAKVKTEERTVHSENCQSKEVG